MIRTGSSTAVTNGPRKSYLTQIGPSKESEERRHILKQKLSFLDDHADALCDDRILPGKKATQSPDLRRRMSCMSKVDTLLTKTTSNKQCKAKTDGSPRSKNLERRRPDKYNLSLSDHGGTSTSKTSATDDATMTCRAPRRHQSLGHPIRHNPPQLQHSPEPTTTTPKHTKAIRRNSSYGVLNNFLEKAESEKEKGASNDEENSIVSSPSHCSKQAIRRTSSFGLFGGGSGGGSGNGSQRAGRTNSNWMERESTEPRTPRRKMSLGSLAGRFQSCYTSDHGSSTDAGSVGHKGPAKTRKWGGSRPQGRSGGNHSDHIRSCSIGNAYGMDQMHSDREADDCTCTTHSRSTRSTSTHVSTDDDYLRKAKERQVQLRQQQQHASNDTSQHRRSSTTSFVKPKKEFDDNGFVSASDSDDSESGDEDLNDSAGPSMLTRGLKALEKLYDDLNV